MNQSFIFVASTATKNFNKGGGETQPDKNGNLPLQLTLIAGKCSNRCVVLNGTIAEAAGIGPNETHVFKATQDGTYEGMPNYRLISLYKLAALDFTKLPTFVKEYGTPNVIDETLTASVSESITNPMGFVEA